MTVTTPQDFIDAWVHQMKYDFEKDGQPVTWAPGFSGPKKWGEESSKATLPGELTSNLAISPDGALIAVGASSDVLIYDAVSLELRRRLRGHVGYLRSVHFHPNGRLLASSTSPTGKLHNKSTFLWDLDEEKPSVEAAKNAADRVASKAVEFALEELVKSAGWTAQDVEAETATIRAGFENTLQSVGIRREGRMGNTFENAELPHFCSYPFSRDGTLLFFLQDRHDSVVYDIAARKERFRIAESNAVMWLGDSPDSRRLAVVSWDRTVRIWSIETGKLEIELKGSTEQNWSGAWSPDGTLLAVGSGDKKVRVWNAQTGELLHALEGFSRWIRSLRFAPDTTGGPLYLAAGAGSGTVRVFDVRSGECKSYWQVDGKRFSGWLEVYELLYGRGPLGEEPIIGFKVGDGRLVVYDAERNVKWEFEQDMDREKRVPGSGTFVFLHDNRSVLSGDRDGTLRKWSLITES